MNKQQDPQAASGRRAAIVSLVISLGMLLIAIATVIPLAAGGFPQSPLYKWIYAAGAVITLGGTLFNPARPGWTLLRRRWHRIEGWSAIFFAVAAVFLFIPGSAPRDAIAFTMAGAVIRIICFGRSFKKY